jgi:hypothetical protein
VAHIRESIRLVKHGEETTKYITPDTTATDIWVLRTLRTMVENRWGMTINERDEEGGEEQDEAVVELMQVHTYTLHTTHYILFKPLFLCHYVINVY